MFQLRPGILSRAAIDAAAGPALGISGTPVTTATEGTAYAGFTVTASGGTAPYTYSVFSGSLPSGITLNSSSGAVSGTPTTAGAYASIVIRATDAVSATANLSSFTITVTAATEIYFSSTKLLMGFTGADASTGAPGMTDESAAARGNATVNGAAQIDTGQFKFGASSLQLGGSGDYISFADSADWDFGTGQFTIEGFFRFTATPTTCVLLAQWSGGWAFYFDAGALKLRSGGAVDTTVYTWSPTLSQWYHIAVDRDASSVARIYVDGVMQSKTTSYTQNLTGSSAALAIGSLRPSFNTYDLTGHIDEVRITKGVARYASDSGFTVPTAAFPRLQTLLISGTPATGAIVSYAYVGFTVSAIGGTAPYTYSVASGSLPPGITLNSSSGAVSGTPTTAGAYASIVLRVTDTASATADLASFTITVSATWTPAALALRAWYQMDLLAGSGGSTITTVTDSSGNGFTLTGVGTPTLAAAHQNGLNTARIPGTTSYFNMSTSVMAGLAQGSVYIVYKGDAASTNYTMMNIGSSGSDSHWPFSDNNNYNDFGSTARKTCGIATNAVTSYRIMSIYSAASDWALYIDGGTGGSGGGTSARFSTATNTVGWLGSTVKIGANAAASTFLTGHIAEIVFTNAKQTTADRQRVEGYLAHKWGIAGNLSASHPYKSAPP